MLQVTVQARQRLLVDPYVSLTGTFRQLPDAAWRVLSSLQKVWPTDSCCIWPVTPSNELHLVYVTAANIHCCHLCRSCGALT